MACDPPLADREYGDDEKRAVHQSDAMDSQRGAVNP